MPELPTNALTAAEFLVRRLYRPIDATASPPLFAVAETEALNDDCWFWNDDNAKVLELMSRPDVWRRFPRETSEIIRFVRSMCQGPFIFRRVGSPRLDFAEEQGGVSRYLHTLMQIRCALSHGMVLAGVRYHDDRSFEHLLLTGNFVEFTYRRQRFRLNADQPIR